MRNAGNVLELHTNPTVDDDQSFKLSKQFTEGTRGVV
jgi:hypothetical protein